jgi:hypothetical protein
MLQWSDFKTQSIQFVAFFPQDYVCDTNRVVRDVLRDWADLFDGEMQVLPPGVELPPEFPRVTLKSEDGRWELRISQMQLVCGWSLKQSPDGDPQRSSIEQPFDVGCGIASNYFDRTKQKATRLACIIRRFASDPDPAAFLIRRFCNAQSQKEPFNRSTSFEVHNLKRYEPRFSGVDFDINSWVRCQSVVNDSSGIAVLQDMNTAKPNDEMAEKFDHSTFSSFFAMVHDESENILKKYFPPSGIAE